MTDKLDYLRTAYWMRGYARALEETGKDCDVLTYNLRKASDMLEEVFDEHNPTQTENVVDAVSGKQYETREFQDFWSNP
jgi:hypothetical protein